MIRALRYRMKYGPYLRNEQGIKKFAERALDQLLSRVTKRSAYYREMNENMLVEKANLRMRAAELARQEMLDASEYFSVRRRITADTTIIVFALVAGVLMTFFSVTAFLESVDAVSAIARWVIAGVFAGVLTYGGMHATEFLLGALIPRRVDEDKREHLPRQAIATMWAVVLAIVLIAILGFAETRAALLSQATGSGMIYFGFILLAMAMPVLAGAFRWDASRFVDVYKTTQAHRRVEDRLAQIDSVLRQNEEFESNFYKLRLLEEWDEVNSFKTYKDNYNERKGIVEHLAGHFSQSFDLFQNEAVKRYESDLRDLTARGLRRLDSSEARSAGGGGKLGAGPRPAAAAAAVPAEGTSDGATASARNVYLAPKPVR